MQRHGSFPAPARGFDRAVAGSAVLAWMLPALRTRSSLSRTAASWHGMLKRRQISLILLSCTMPTNGRSSIAASTRLWKRMPQTMSMSANASLIAAASRGRTAGFDRDRRGAELGVDGGEHLGVVRDGGALLKDQKDHAVALLLPMPDSVSQRGDGSFAGLWRNRQADGRHCAGRSLPVAARRQGSPREDQIVGEARLGAGALSQRSVVAHQKQLAARDDAAQEPSSCRATQIADTDTERRNPHAQRAGEMADQPLQRQRGEPAVVVKHRAAAEDQPAALPQQARHAPDEADEPGMPRSRLIVEDRVDAGGDDVLSKVRQVRAVIAQQKPRCRAGSCAALRPRPSAGDRRRDCRSRNSRTAIRRCGSRSASSGATPLASCVHTACRRG